MKTQTVYKVLLRKSKKLFSFAGSQRPTDSLSIRYFTNRVNKPIKGRNPFLFCFRNLRDAQFIAGDSPFYTIYEAEATGIHYVGICSNGVYCNSAFYAPGCIFAKSLKLTKRVK